MATPTSGLTEAELARSLLGVSVRKLFRSYGSFGGAVSSFDPQSRLYTIGYEDGQQESVPLKTLVRYLLPEQSSAVRAWLCSAAADSASSSADAEGPTAKATGEQGSSTTAESQPGPREMKKRCLGACYSADDEGGGKAMGESPTETRPAQECVECPAATYSGWRATIDNVYIPCGVGKFSIAPPGATSEASCRVCLGRRPAPAQEPAAVDNATFQSAEASGALALDNPVRASGTSSRFTLGFCESWCLLVLVQ